MNDWDMLEIKPTVEISDIKKAYAKKLRICHPEDNPQAFQQLREAYIRAIDYAKYYLEHPDEIIIEANCISSEKEIQNDDEESKEIYYDKNEDNPDFHPSPRCKFNLSLLDKNKDDEKLLNKFIDKVDKVYTSFFDRIEIKNWREILSDDIMWRIDIKEAINWKMLDYFTNHYYLPRDIWRLLNKTFHWDEKDVELYYFYPKDFIIYLFQQLGEDRVPRYCFFDKNVKINFNEYLDFRESAFIALIENDLKKADELITSAAYIYPNDPDLYCMRGEYHFRQGHTKAANLEFKKISTMKPEDLYIFYYKANVLYNLGLYDDACQVCYKIYNHKTEIYELHLLTGKCLLKADRWEEASQIFIDILKKNPLDINAKRYLFEIKRIYKNRLTIHHYALFKRLEYKRILDALGESQVYNEFNITKDIKSQLYKFSDFLFHMCAILFFIFLIIITHGFAIVVALIIHYTIKKKKK